MAGTTKRIDQIFVVKSEPVSNAEDAEDICVLRGLRDLRVSSVFRFGGGLLVSSACPPLARVLGMRSYAREFAGNCFDPARASF